MKLRHSYLSLLFLATSQYKINTIVFRFVIFLIFFKTKHIHLSNVIQRISFSSIGEINGIFFKVCLRYTSECVSH